jgi:hypothetical protein
LPLFSLSPFLDKENLVKVFVTGLHQRTIARAFYAIYGVVLLLALFPPLYLAASGTRGPVILGLPFSIAYWILDAILLGVSLWVLYIVEGVRGELIDDGQKASELL